MKRRVILIFVAAITIVFFTACGDPAKKLEGSWRLQGGGYDEIITFYSNGMMANEDGDMVSYFVEDGKIVAIEDGELQALPYEISGTTLTLYTPEGYTMQLEKVR